MSAPRVIGMAEMNGIFEVVDRLGISREAISVPLRPASPGSVQRLRSGEFEITVDADQPFGDWLQSLEAQLRALLGD